MLKALGGSAVAILAEIREVRVRITRGVGKGGTRDALRLVLVNDDMPTGRLLTMNDTSMNQIGAQLNSADYHDWVGAVVRITGVQHKDSKTGKPVLQLTRWDVVARPDEPHPLRKGLSWSER